MTDDELWVLCEECVLIALGYSYQGLWSWHACLRAAVEGLEDDKRRPVTSKLRSIGML